MKLISKSGFGKEYLNVAAAVKDFVQHGEAPTYNIYARAIAIETMFSQLLTALIQNDLLTPEQVSAIFSFKVEAKD